MSMSCSSGWQRGATCLEPGLPAHLAPDPEENKEADMLRDDSSGLRPWCCDQLYTKTKLQVPHQLDVLLKGLRGRLLSLFTCPRVCSWMVTAELSRCNAA